MKRAIIWKPGFDDGSQGEMPNIGVGILANEFRELGYSTVIWDQHLCPEIGFPSIRLPADIFAVSLVSQEWSRETVQRIIRERHDAGSTVIVGGPHTMGYGVILLEHKFIDKIVIGEIDGRLHEVLDSPERLRVFKPVKREDMGTPDFRGMVGRDKVVAYPLYTSRGCTNSCSFCAGALNHRGFRTRSMDDIFYELDELWRFPNLKLVHVVDDCFTGDIEHAKKFLEEYWKFFETNDGPLIPLHVINVRADQIDKEVLMWMKECGVKELPIGVESGDPDVFKWIGKRETLDQIRDAVKMIQEAGITPWLNMIVGLPGDTPERHMNSIDFVRSLPDPKIAHWFMFSPFRGTRAYQELVRREIIEDGFIPDAYGRRYDCFPWYPEFQYPDFKAFEMARAQLQAYLFCKSPILINTPDIEQRCKYHGLEEEYQEWRKTAPIEEYIKNHQGFKKEKGQI